MARLRRRLRANVQRVADAVAEDVEMGLVGFRGAVGLMDESAGEGLDQTAGEDTDDSLEWTPAIKRQRRAAEPQDIRPREPMVS